MSEDSDVNADLQQTDEENTQVLTWYIGKDVVDASIHEITMAHKVQYRTYRTRLQMDHEGEEWTSTSKIRIKLTSQQLLRKEK